MSVNPSPIGGYAGQFFDNNGHPLSGGKVYTYAAGTTTPQATYTSALGTTPHANPIVLDSAGRVPGGEIWLTDGLSYKFTIETSSSILIGTYDNIEGINPTLNADLIDYDPPFLGALTSGYTVENKLAQCVSVKDFGAVGDGVTDDTAAIINALNAAIGKTLIVGPGVYNFASGAQTITLTDNIEIIADDATFLNGHSAATTLILSAEEMATPTFTGVVARGSVTINVDSTSGVFPGMLVFINSNKIYETGYNYRQCEVHKVVSTTPTSITFSEPVVFSYDATTDGVTVSVRRDVGVTISGPLTLTYPTVGGGIGRVLDLRFLSNTVINNLRCIDPQKRKGTAAIDPLLIGESYNTTVFDFFAKGARYCANVTNGSRNTSFENVESQECWHPIDFNTASYNCYVSNIRGQGNTATIQSHPCFNLSYQDVYSEGDQFVLPRAIGVYISNAKINTDYTMDSNGFISVVSLVNDISNEFNFVVKDYVLNAPNAVTKQNVRVDNNYRTATFDNVNAGEIGVFANTSTEIYVRGCYVASLRQRGDICYISDTLIDANHPQSVGINAYALSMANLQGVRFSNCDIRGGHSYLIDSPINAPQDIIFSNCIINSISTGMFTGTVAGLTGVDILFSNCVGASNTFNLAATYVGGSRIRTSNCVGLSQIESYKRGSATATTDGSGNINIAHGIYAAPTWGQVIIQGDNTYVAQIEALNSTNITVRVGNMATAGGDVVSTSVTVIWEAAIT